MLLLHQPPLVSNLAAAERGQLPLRSVQRWRGRWAQGDCCLAGTPGRGRKAVFPPLGHALGQAVACELVAATQPPLSRPPLADLTARVRSALGQPISRSTGWRLLGPEASKPWRDTAWLSPRDPRFAEKAGALLDW